MIIINALVRETFNRLEALRIMDHDKLVEGKNYFTFCPNCHNLGIWLKIIPGIKELGYSQCWFCKQMAKPQLMQKTEKYIFPFSWFELMKLEMSQWLYTPKNGAECMEQSLDEMAKRVFKQ